MQEPESLKKRAKDRRKRQAEALRANLKRRKQAANDLPDTQDSPEERPDD
jgi:hypothetical protein